MAYQGYDFDIVHHSIEPYPSSYSYNESSPWQWLAIYFGRLAIGKDRNCLVTIDFERLASDSERVTISSDESSIWA